MLPKPHLPIPKYRSGSTLIELMIVIMILFVAISSFISAICTATQLQSHTTSESRVLEQIQRTIEQIQNTDFGQIQTTWHNTGFDVQGVEAQSGSDQVGSVRVFSSTTSKIPVRITASWQDEQGPCTLSVVYVHTNRGG